LIAVADINTLWRKKPFEALALQVPVLGLAPQDLRMAWRRRQVCDTLSSQGPYTECSVTLPPGWASKWTSFTAWRLWGKAWKVAQDRGTPLSGLVVTSPHYLKLVKYVGSKVPCFYYCSDDYSQYADWGGQNLLKQEEKLVQSVRHSFFVSRTLADRAVQAYGVPANRVSVSPNATEERFLTPVAEEQTGALFRQFPALKRPLVGVVGGINDRLDFDLIARCAALPAVGSVVMVGGVDEVSGGEGLKRLQSEPRCVFVGRRPHEELPAWMQALDVALIPYRDMPLNRACSPMRLFDHLASGRCIVATSSCEQVREFSSQVRVCSTPEAVLREVVGFCVTPRQAEQIEQQRQFAECHAWNRRVHAMIETMKGFVS
jgi:glycosyltransferase involved in cell wall biosynthesis